MPVRFPWATRRGLLPEPSRFDAHADAPLGRVATVGVPSAGFDQRLELRAVEVGAHDAHALAVRPVELPSRPIELELLRRERAALRDDRLPVSTVDVGTLDRPIVLAGHAHVGPVDVSRLGIDDDAVRHPTAGDDHASIGAVRLHRQDPPGAGVEHEQAAGAVVIGIHGLAHLRVLFGSRDGPARTEAGDLLRCEPNLSENLVVVLADLRGTFRGYFRHVVHRYRAADRPIELPARALERHDDAVRPELRVVDDAPRLAHDAVRDVRLVQDLLPVRHG